MGTSKDSGPPDATVRREQTREATHPNPPSPPRAVRWRSTVTKARPGPQATWPLKRGQTHSRATDLTNIAVRGSATIGNVGKRVVGGSLQNIVTVQLAMSKSDHKNVKMGEIRNSRILPFQVWIGNLSRIAYYFPSPFSPLPLPRPCAA